MGARRSFHSATFLFVTSALCALSSAGLAQSVPIQTAIPQPVIRAQPPTVAYVQPTPVYVQAAPPVYASPKVYVPPTTTVVTPSATVIVQPAGTTVIETPQPAFVPPPDKDTATLGIEGFRDHYREPSLDVTDNTNYGSVDGSYMHEFGGGYFVATDGRASYGTDNYKSGSGHESGEPEWEYELRGRTGLVIWEDENSRTDGYVGFGVRHYIDEGKGRKTDTGALAYDRRITQLYIPVGVTYAEKLDDVWSIVPTLEYDQFLWGNVNSRLQNNGPVCFNPSGSFPGGCTRTGVNAYNNQLSGYGARGDLMIREKLGGTASWEFGPFVRYWNIHQSENGIYPLTVPGYVDVTDEPTNNRLQAGIKLNVLW